MKRAISLLASGALAAAALATTGSLSVRQAGANYFRPCHDDTSYSRTNTHGSPLNGSFGTSVAKVSSQRGYYYLDISTGPGCVGGVDGHVHLLGRVTANGIGLLPGCTPSSNWGPPCDPRYRAVVMPALAAERPGWGFEIKDGNNGATLACTGGDGAGGTCPSPWANTPNKTAVPGNAAVEFRYDAAVPNHDYRFRLANQYDDAIWETATFDVVACSTCEPGRTAPPPPPPPPPPPQGAPHGSAPPSAGPLAGKATAASSAKATPTAGATTPGAAIAFNPALAAPLGQGPSTSPGPPALQSAPKSGSGGMDPRLVAAAAGIFGPLVIVLAVAGFLLRRARSPG